MPQDPQTPNKPIQFGAMAYSKPPTDLDAVRLYRLGRIRQELARHDYAGGLFFDPINTRYATDATNMQIWCTHYETRCVLVMTAGPTVLFDYAELPALAQGLPTIDDYQVMEAFYYFAAGDRSPEVARRFGQQIKAVVAAHGSGNRRLAVDRLSHQGIDALRAEGLEIFDGQEVAEIAKSIKSPGEIALMKASIAVCQEGMEAMREALVPGTTENAVWSKLHETNIARGGEWIETRLLAAGPRSNPWFQESSLRPIQAGELMSFDSDLIGPYGYCADISRCWRCGNGPPDDEQRRLYALAHEQVRFNSELLRPGMSFREAAEKSWPLPDEYATQRYSCIIHGVGLADEWPSIPFTQDWAAYGYDGLIEPGMTLCVESYIGALGGLEGVKLEQQVLVTESGIEPLSTYPFEEAWL